MATFKDKAGRTWDLELNFETADLISAQAGIDLIDPAAFDKTFMLIAYGDPRTLRDIVWLMCGDQAGRDGVTREAFSKAIGPDQLRAALEAVQEAIACFSPRPELADAKRKAFRAIIEVAEENVPGAIDRKISEAVKSARSAMNSPASSALPTSAG